MEPHIAPESVSPAPLARLLTSIGFWASRPPPGSERERNPQIDVFVVTSYIYRNVLHIRANVRVSAMEPHIAPESVSPAPLTRLLTSIGFWASRPPPGSERERNPQILIPVGDSSVALVYMKFKVDKRICFVIFEYLSITMRWKMCLKLGWHRWTRWGESTRGGAPRSSTGSFRVSNVGDGDISVPGKA
ncbi:hypothetical protein B0H13DRAFT_1893326 [Mycena leptocephala]|nr:hypothetical protein B0H13DRAFT_1893326 [Mycena leptocephala]